MRPAPRLAPRALALLLVCWLFTALARADEPPRLVVISWDGAADWVVDRLLVEGELPNLAALAERGVRADYSVTSFPSKTAVGHATLWTGCWPAVHGITANSVPAWPPSERTLLDVATGFSSEALTAEPFYVTAAKAGRRVAVLSATQSYPETRWVEELSRAGVPSDRYFSASGFEHEMAPGVLHRETAFRPASRGWNRVPGRRAGGLEATVEVAGETFHLLAFDSTVGPTRGLDRLLVRQGSRRAQKAAAETVLAPGEAAGSGYDPALWSPPLRVESNGIAGNVFFRLFALAQDGSEIAIYQRQVSGLRGAAPPELMAEYLAAYPGFHDDPFWLYRNGGLGTPLLDGGDGAAEERVLELVAHDVDLLVGGARWAFARLDPDVLFHYSPMIDSAGHVWLGLLDPAGPRYDPELAARIWSYYARVHRQLDRWLGELVQAAGPEAIVALVSDHGMAATHQDLYPNRVLEEAGLLARGEDGEIDLTRTRILFPRGGAFALHVNGVEHRGGIVRPEERPAVLAAAERALLSVRDPETGRPVVTRVFYPQESPGLGIGGPRGGDLYYDLAPGYYERDRPAEAAVLPSRSPWGEGNHGFWSERRDMHAILYAAGPGLAAGLTTPPIRHVDVVPTLARAVGLPPPPRACGHVVGEMLVDERSPRE